MQQRYYDPALQRFISVDPVNYVAGNVIKFNRYSYANLNPFGYSDPDGRDPEWYSNVDPMGNPGAGNPLGGVAITSGVGAFALLGGAAAIPEVVGAAGPEIAEGVGSNLARTAGQQLSREARRGIASLERRILEHRAKLEAFKANPTVRQGMEKLSKELIEAQKNARVQHLEKEIQTFIENIAKLRNPPPPATPVPPPPPLPPPPPSQ